MTGPWEEFERKMQRAARDVAPMVNVTERVIGDLSRPMQAEPDNHWSWWICAAASLAAALLVMTLAWEWYQSVDDPLRGLIEPISVVMR